MSSPLRTFGLLLVAALPLLGGARRADAGCGCNKPPPPPASLRPAVTTPGREITVFHPSLVVGEQYTVRFASGTVAATAPMTRDATAVLRRDLADGVARPMLALPLPELPLGPARVEVKDAAGKIVLSLDDDALTVAPPPVPILTGVDRYEFKDVRAAVGRDGTVYMALDFTAVREARVFRAQALGYPLRFTHEDVAFWNVQGFLMQLLGTRMPGLYAIASGSANDSDRLQYSRHEFETYFLDHQERAPHAVDPSDPNWHLDGTPHVDHDHQIIAIAGTLEGGAPPAAGATPPFDLVVESFTLFHHGLFANDRAEVSGVAQTDSYDSRTGNPGTSGDVRSNDSIFVDTGATVAGDVSGVTLDILGTVTGTQTAGVAPEELLPVTVPAAATDIGDLEVDGDDVYVLGPGSYSASDLQVSGNATLQIDNLAGPVTLYVSGEVKVTSTVGIVAGAQDPERFALYVAGDGNVQLANSASFYGVVYGPGADVQVTGNGEFFGAFVGDKVRITGSGRVHYDEALRANKANPPPAEHATLEIVKARLARSGRISIVVRSSAEGLVPLTVTIDGMPAEQPMRWKRGGRKWVYHARAAASLGGAMVTVRGTDGAEATAALR